MVAVDRGPMPRQSRSRSRRRRRGGAVTLVLALLLLGAGLWSAYWYAAYRLADYALPERAETAGALTCRDRELSGFPFNLSLTCREFAAAADGMIVSAGGVDANAPLYRPGHVAASLVGPFEFDAAAAGVSAIANWTDAEAVVDVGLAGVTHAAADFAALDLSLSGPAGALHLTADRLGGAVAPTLGEADAIGVDFVADGLRLGPLPPVSGEGTVHFLGAGEALGADLGSLLANWVAAGAEMRVEAARLAVGGVALRADGPLSIEPDGSLSGQLTIRFSGAAALPDLVAAIVPAFRSQAEELATGLLALSRPIDGNEGPAHELRLTLDHGQVNVGLIPVLTLPPLASR